MRSRRTRLLSTSVIPFVVFMGVAVGGMDATGPLAGSPVYAACNPCAVANPCSPCAAANPCNPCAVANPCSPCAASNPCNPCAAGGGGASLACAVPRLQAAARCNPCAVTKSCSPCNPCAAANPCNPCAAANPCNPCAAANPCNPCAAAACSPCSPCGAAGAIELTDAEATEVYDCLLKEMQAAYAKSDNEVALGYTAWRRFSRRAYPSATHGNRHVQNYANEAAKSYGAYEEAGPMPDGAKLAKDSFSVMADGSVSVGPLFVMEKMPADWNPDSGDWRYTMIMPDGSVFGATKGKGAAKVEFCVGCHIAVASETDSLMLVPGEYRVK